MSKTHQNYHHHSLLQFRVLRGGYLSGILSLLFSEIHWVEFSLSCFFNFLSFSSFDLFGPKSAFNQNGGHQLWIVPTHKPWWVCLNTLPVKVSWAISRQCCYNDIKGWFLAFQQAWYLCTPAGMYKFIDIYLCLQARYAKWWKKIIIFFWGIHLFLCVSMIFQGEMLLWNTSNFLASFFLSNLISNL